MIKSFAQQWLQRQKPQKTKYQEGIYTEAIGEKFLEEKGYEIIASRYKLYGIPAAGEIDIIATKENLIIFVEVKKRQTLELAGEVIFETQMNGIIASAQIFLADHLEYTDFDCRFDAILFDDNYNISHIENAWSS